MSEIDLFDEMGEIAAELDQLQRAREQFAAEQTAARFAAAAEARREDVDDERNRGPTPTEMERISAEITARVREESLAQLKEVMRAFLAEAASGAEGAAAAAVGEALAARFAAASPSFDQENARAREGKTEAFGSPADAAVTREDGETEDAERKGGEDGAAATVETENASEDPSPSIRHLKPPDISDFDAATKTIVDGASSDAKAVARADAAAAARSDDGSESDIVDEIGHVSRVDATRSEAESIPEESLARDVDDLDARRRRALFSTSPRRRIVSRTLSTIGTRR